jgi:DNA polymerase III gamma/tau subunit
MASATSDAAASRTGDKVGDADEVAAIIGAPNGKLLMNVLMALNEKDIEKGLEALREAEKNNIEMKLFVRLLLERVRAVMLIRNLPGRKDEILSAFSEDDAKVIGEMSKTAASPINSHLLLRLLDAADQTLRTQLPHLPLEVAIIDLCQKPE